MPHPASTSSLPPLGLDGLSLLTESVAELPADNIKMPHPARTSSLPPLGLDGPIVLPDLSLGVATWGAPFLLDVEGDLPTPAAQGVGLIAPFSKGAGSLGHGDFLASLVEVNQAN